MPERKPRRDEETLEKIRWCIHSDNRTCTEMYICLYPQKGMKYKPCLLYYGRCKKREEFPESYNT